MAKKEDNNGSSLGDITLVRNILMGKQMDEYDGRFTTLENQLQEQEVIFKQKIQALEKQMADQLAQMQKDMSTRVNSLEGLLQNTNAQMSQQRAQERQKLGEMLVEMGNRLLE